MPDNISLSDLNESLSAPLGDLIAAVGRGVADAQESLDNATLQSVKNLYTSSEQAQDDLRRIGYHPTWFKIPEVDAQINVSLSVTGTSTESGLGSSSPSGGRIRLYAAPVDATYRNRYDFDLKAASSLRFRIVPVPPSVQASDLKAVPSLKDKTYSQAKKLLDKLDIEYQHEGSGATTDDTLVTSYSPQAGQLLAADGVVTLKTAAAS